MNSHFIHIFVKTTLEKMKEISMKKFFKVAEKVGLVKDGYYKSGSPKGSEEDVNEFYILEDKLDYPKSQRATTEISMQEYHEMRNEAWDMAVKTKMVEDKDSEWSDFDEEFYDYLVWEKGYTIVD